jgi:hypothetical protein
MYDKSKKPDYSSNEKKVWRPESAQQIVIPEEMRKERDDKGNLKYPPGIYFIGIEELQGAWVNGEWEEAGGVETWTEISTDTYTDDTGLEHSVTTKKNFRSEVPRARRYIVKYIDDKGSARNAFPGSFSGPREYK